MPPTTAILLFSRSASAEAATKGFGRATDSLSASRALLRRTRNTLGRSGLPVYHYDEGRQRGPSFGDRLARAMAEVFARGYESIIVVGNDCPGLRVSHLDQAARALAEGRNVLGPDQRGGIWLLGLHRSHFTEPLIRGISWQSHRVMTELSAALEEVVQLARLADLNDRGDVIRHWYLLRSMLPELQGLLKRRSIMPFGRLLRRTTGAKQVATGRGPPLGQL
ncbi:hypothetical protein GGR26_001406 [Lewinella marina]|uniref:DUF2064 domain-containing protein n=1 Tax=Neolewinella marina TaxID=438751 RepID=A0A2G0CFF8_9BACT|nr:DUF2064 domain-containing protein [Neolewinella marina]NJB85661.1 hypothetical protein [Neolewinella marina]PHK98657.1 hypothetical protein CGL56_09310 [Neolewinella marina]